MIGLNRPRAVAVALISAGTLCYEILLVRVFAIEYFHHLAFMAIGVAMLGFGAGGTLLALVGRIEPQRAARWLALSVLVTPLTLMASPFLVHSIELDLSRLMWDPSQWIRLVFIYTLLALPFFCSALAVLTALGMERDRPGRIYGASFLGSALGAALALGSLWLFLPTRALAVPALIAAGGTLILGVPLGRNGQRTGWSVRVAPLVIALVVLSFPPWRLTVTPYKGLPQVEAYPGATRVAERGGALGWVVAVAAPAFRYAPGLSLGYRGLFPRQTALFVDGETVGAATFWSAGSTATGLLDWLPSALPYALGATREDVLVIGAGSGLELESALYHGAERVTALDLRPAIADFQERFGNLPEELTTGGKVRWVTSDARAFSARTRERFDLVTIAVGGTLGGGAAGVHSLDEDFVHTVEAYTSYLRLLGPDGVFSVTRWINMPPRENVRVILTAMAALRHESAGSPPPGLLVARSWGTVTVLVKPDGFTTAEVDAARRWCRTRGIDVDWYPGIGGEPIPDFNLIGEPVFYRAARAAFEGPDAATQFARNYEFHVAPARDARPFPHHYLRATAIPAFFAGNRGDWLPFAEWAYIALGATLLQSGFLATVFVVLPAVLLRRRTPPLRLLPVIAYFGSIGFAFMAVEIAAIQQLSFLLGHPVYAVAAVLSAFLVCAGMGSIWTDRVRAAAGSRVGIGLVLLLLIYSVSLLPLAHFVESLSLVVRATLAVGVLAPPAFLMGWMFPLGLRRLTRGEGDLLPWAWAANGFASVVAAPLAALMALELGSQVLFAAGALAYGVASLVYASDQTSLPPTAER